jgi:hypothetical protein
MDDVQTTKDSDQQPEEERQNRRQFFNGLGKWSLAIIAAVVGLREGPQDLERGIGSRFGTGEPRKRIARKSTGPVHTHKAGHVNVHTHHAFHCNGPFRDTGCN